jgi:regulator of RNase E activity RraA
MDGYERRKFLRQVGLAGAGGLLGGFPLAGAPADTPPVAVPAEGILTPEEFALLKRWDAPTIANALERTGVRPATAGFMGPAIRPQFPEFGPLAGYAVTATIQASKPRGEGRYADSFQYYEFIQSLPMPRIMVIHDLDAPNPVGSFWGEVHGNLHRALGCSGVITDGGVRDLGPVRALRFHLFAAAVLVSHAHVHLVDFGKPVVVGGLEVKPGDLLFGDEHGVIQIPHALARKTAGLCHEVYQSERPAIDFYQSPDFSLEKLRAFRAGKK